MRNTIIEILKIIIKILLVLASCLAWVLFGVLPAFYAVWGFEQFGEIIIAAFAGAWLIATTAFVYNLISLILLW